MERLRAVEGTICLVHARRCGRAHCRSTGPNYFVLIAPVPLPGSGAVAFVSCGWWMLGGLILLGSKVIWWATDARWGAYTHR